MSDASHGGNVRRGHTLERAGRPRLVASCTLLIRAPIRVYRSADVRKSAPGKTSLSKEEHGLTDLLCMAFCYLCSENILALLPPPNPSPWPRP